jgi:DNA-directed RNA polymerase specialized sigma24 family protein
MAMARRVVQTVVASGTSESRTIDAFEALSDRSLDDAYRLATVILRDPIEAQDVVHDAVLVGWRKFGSLRDPSRFDAWFGRIVLNLCRDRLRERRRGRVREAALGAEIELAADSAGFGHLIPLGIGHLIPLGIGHPVPRVLATL